MHEVHGVAGKLAPEVDTGVGEGQHHVSVVILAQVHETDALRRESLWSEATIHF